LIVIYKCPKSEGMGNDTEEMVPLSGLQLWSMRGECSRSEGMPTR